jgi:hypothetical protein
MASEVSGERHPRTLATHQLRGSILREVEAGLAAHRRVHEGLVQVLGNRHPRVLHAAVDVGLSLAACGDAGGAEASLGAMLAGQTEVLGAAHPDLRRTEAALVALRDPATPEAATSGARGS